MTTSESTTYILNQVVNYLGNQGIELSLKDLEKHIKPLESRTNTHKKRHNKKFVVKPNEFDTLTKRWKKRLIEFHNNFPIKNETLQ